jgi:hypothetical protein
MMLALGNDKVNSIYESALPLDIKKPDSETDRPTREAFIKMKYQEKKFVEKGVLKPAELNKKLYQASKTGDLAEVLKSITLGADINYQNELEDLKTPLHVAIIEGQVTSVMLLCQNRANVNALDAKGWTPMHYATLYGMLYC